MLTPEPRRASRSTLPADAAFAKAARPLRIARRLPSAAEVEVERSLWGKHPDALQAWVEDSFFALGHHFIHGMVHGLTGRSLPAVAKAGPGAPNWQDVMALFRSPAPPEQKMATWGTLVDQLAGSLLPGRTVVEQTAMWALRSALLTKIGERVRAVTTPGAWDSLFLSLPDAQQQQVEWSRLRGAQFVTNMGERARAAARDALLESQMGGGNHHDLTRVLLERMGTLNRDWRRIAITETGMAVSSGQLMTALSAGGDWEAVWVAGPRACPFCRSQNGTVLKVVPASHPNLDGQTMVWPGKHNVGRSAHLHRRDGTRRGPDELWWPCLPAHPLCGCVFSLRRALTSKAARDAAAKLAAIRAEKFRQAVG